RRATEHRYPNWLIGTSIYADGLSLRVATGTKRELIDGFLSSIFGARYEPTRGILLEATPGSSRIFTVEIEQLERDASAIQTRSLTPTFHRIVAISGMLDSSSLPPDLPDGSPEIFAFYSFKGGVGRTTH